MQQLRSHLDEIEDAIARGVLVKDVYKYLTNSGTIDVCYGTFRTMLHRLRKQRIKEIEQRGQAPNGLINAGGPLPPLASPTPHSVEAQEIAAPAKAIEKSTSSQPPPSETPRKMSWKEMRKKQVDY